MICVLPVSTISAMVMAGPRVLQVAGEDLPRLRPLAERTRGGAPLRAIMLQQLLAIVFVLPDSFEGVLSYAGFTLNLMALLTVAGVFVLRYTAPDPPPEQSDPRLVPVCKICCLYVGIRPPAAACEKQIIPATQMVAEFSAEIATGAGD
jgi:amino acid transporter